ncbi:MAG TPA: hydrolase, partial [Variovorax sp.]|nr:hydrolase [Variovorax sp.]
MRIATFRHQGRRHVGIVSDDLQSVAPFQWTEARALRGAQAFIEDHVIGHESMALTSAPVPMSQIQLEAPLPLPRRNIFCVGRNY